MKKTVLVFDDDAKLQKLLEEFLGSYGYTVQSRPDGNAACSAVRDTQPDVVILDVMMPGKDGMEVLQDIRREFDVPIIMLTAKGEDSDRIVGLELGADDYVSKPFNPRELLARMKAVLRRTSGNLAEQESTTRLEAAGLVLDMSRRILLVEGDEIVISQTECRLLETFMANPDKPLTRDELMNQVWGKAFIAYDRSIDVHVSKLRATLKPYPDHADLIQTVWGTGYRFRGCI